MIAAPHFTTTKLRGDGASTSSVAQTAAATPAHIDGRGQGIGWWREKWIEAEWGKKSTAPHRSTPRIDKWRPRLALALLLAGLIITAQALYIPAKAQLAQVLMARAWERELATSQPTRPWPWADFTPAAKLSFPAQNRSVLALSDAAGESLAFGPTLMAASARPGQPGVTVFAAHRDTHFAFLGQVRTGDIVKVETRDGPVRYRITGSEVVRWNASGIQPHDDGPSRLALVTCWPLDANFHGVLRLVVWGEMTA